MAGCLSFGDELFAFFLILAVEQVVVGPCKIHEIILGIIEEIFVRSGINNIPENCRAYHCFGANANLAADDEIVFEVVLVLDLDTVSEDYVFCNIRFFLVIVKSYLCYRTARVVDEIAVDSIAFTGTGVVNRVAVAKLLHYVMQFVVLDNVIACVSESACLGRCFGVAYFVPADSQHIFAEILEVFEIFVFRKPFHRVENAEVPWPNAAYDNSIVRQVVYAVIAGNILAALPDKDRWCVKP